MKLINVALKTAKASVLAAAKFGEVLTENHTMSLGEVNAMMLAILSKTPLETYTPQEKAAWFYAYTSVCLSAVMATKEEDFEVAKQTVKEHFAWTREQFDIPNMIETIKENVRWADVPQRLMANHRIAKDLQKNAKEAGLGFGMDYLMSQLSATARMPGRFIEVAEIQSETHMGAAFQLTLSDESAQLDIH